MGEENVSDWGKGWKTLNVKKELKRSWNEYIVDLYVFGEKPREIDMGVEKEYKVHQDEKGYCILKSEINETNIMMKKGKAKGFDEVPIVLFKALGETGELSLLDVPNEILEGKWPDDFRVTVLVPIEKKRNTKKCEEHRMISLVLFTAEVLLGI
ncbi:uncharacterized protein LOC142317675 [Lycorma delicatula]|uniref:uncharacterized protein LOC142317675 n=1 Tax=Lycorma delicatula TaxID=130591 RepID=UPI003F519860